MYVPAAQCVLSPFSTKPNSLAPFFYEYLSLLYSLIVNKKCLQKFSLFGAYFINGHVLLSWNFYRFHFLSAFACCVDYATFPSILCALSLFLWYISEQFGSHTLCDRLLKIMFGEVENSRLLGARRDYLGCVFSVQLSLCHT